MVFSAPSSRAVTCKAVVCSGLLGSVCAPGTKREKEKPRLVASCCSQHKAHLGRVLDRKSKEHSANLCEIDGGLVSIESRRAKRWNQQVYYEQMSAHTSGVTSTMVLGLSEFCCNLSNRSPDCGPGSASAHRVTLTRCRSKRVITTQCQIIMHYSNLFYSREFVLFR